ncbi:hypothetical protein [Streptomyces sp. 5-10]|uniref:hypothetical protein n=1 Tax=Streptomyces sp. 5-10 TaxID=878925 RepID=UPI00168AF743|nr:hypothetical protein [Streptomyces sp. 5-10]MBD3004767.1 hypothetical protein [Streptomyces sp. 5-10]
MTTTVKSGWIHGLVSFSGTGSYPVRTQVSLPHGTYNSADLAGMDEEQSWLASAAHELGHAAAHLRYGVHVMSVDLYRSVDLWDSESPRAEVSTWMTNDQLTSRGALVASAAGERAQDRWLREKGLWTPVRSLEVEVAARTDRFSVVRMDPRVGFGDTEIDYADLMAEADAVLADFWTRLEACVPALLAAGSWSGDEVASRLGVVNPPAPS